jgi:hypothetical protein
MRHFRPVESNTCGPRPPRDSNPSPSRADVSSSTSRAIEGYTLAVCSSERVVKRLKAGIAAAGAVEGGDGGVQRGAGDPARVPQGPLPQASPRPWLGPALDPPRGQTGHSVPRHAALLIGSDTYRPALGDACRSCTCPDSLSSHVCSRTSRAARLTCTSRAARNQGRDGRVTGASRAAIPSMAAAPQRRRGCMCLLRGSLHGDVRVCVGPDVSCGPCPGWAASLLQGPTVMPTSRLREDRHAVFPQTFSPPAILSSLRASSLPTSLLRGSGSCW